MTKSIYTMLLLAALMMTFAGCNLDDDDGDDGNGGGSGSAPTVLSTTPADGATTVPLNTGVIARFSEPMDGGTISATSFTLTGPGVTPVTGTVSYDSVNRVAEFLPTAPLASGTVFTALLSDSITDAGGTPMASDYSWTFTTGATADTTAPTVTSTNPADLATAVPTNRIVVATFSEQVDSSTVNATSFTLMDGVTPIAGTVSSPGSTATFTPAGPLPANTSLTARLTTAVEDLAGNPLAADYVWSFTTGNVASTGPAPVVLGTAENYVIIAKSTVTNTGATAVVGDVALSPAAGSFFTGFAETLDGSGEFATSVYVTGNMYAATYTAPTPSILTTAVLDMQTAYDDAKDRTLPDELNLAGGNIDGMTLSPGLYKWGSSVNIPSSLTLSGGANDVWIFQISQNLVVGNGAIVTLTGGASASNIFWQVAGQATLGTTSDFKGIILCKTQIVLMTGATVLGRALAQTAVTLDATAITEP